MESGGRAQRPGSRAGTQRWIGIGLPHARRSPILPETLRYTERLLKFLLWQKGGYRVTVAGDPRIADHLRAVYSPAGERAFDYQFMGDRVYGRPMVIESVPLRQSAGGTRGRRAAGPPSGRLPHRLRSRRERPQVRRRGRRQSGLQRRSAVAARHASRSAVPLRRRQRFAAPRRGAPAARRCHRRQRRGSLRRQRSARRIALPVGAARCFRQPHPPPLLRPAGRLERHSVRCGQRRRSHGAGRLDGARRQCRARDRHGQQPGRGIRHAAGQHHDLAQRAGVRAGGLPRECAGGRVVRRWRCRRAVLLAAGGGATAGARRESICRRTCRFRSSWKRCRN